MVDLNNLNTNRLNRGVAPTPTPDTTGADGVSGSEQTPKGTGATKTTVTNATGKGTISVPNGDHPGLKPPGRHEMPPEKTFQELAEGFELSEAEMNEVINEFTGRKKDLNSEQNKLQSEIAKLAKNPALANAQTDPDLAKAGNSLRDIGKALTMARKLKRNIALQDAERGKDNAGLEKSVSEQKLEEADKSYKLQKEQIETEKAAAKSKKSTQAFQAVGAGLLILAGAITSIFGGAGGPMIAAGIVLAIDAATEGAATKGISQGVQLLGNAVGDAIGGPVGDAMKHTINWIISVSVLAASIFGGPGAVMMASTIVLQTLTETITEIGVQIAMAATGQTREEVEAECGVAAQVITMLYAIAAGGAAGIKQAAKEGVKNAGKTATTAGAQVAKTGIKETIKKGARSAANLGKKVGEKLGVKAGEKSAENLKNLSMGAQMANDVAGGVSRGVQAMEEHDLKLKQADITENLAKVEAQIEENFQSLLEVLKLSKKERMQMIKDIQAEAAQIHSDILQMYSSQSEMMGKIAASDRGA